MRRRNPNGLFVLAPILLVIGGILNVLAAVDHPLRLAVAIVLLVLAVLYLAYGLVGVWRQRRSEGKPHE